MPGEHSTRSILALRTVTELLPGLPPAPAELWEHEHRLGQASGQWDGGICMKTKERVKDPLGEQQETAGEKRTQGHVQAGEGP